jgi:4-hydroxythreonine-4-phosphate dehydrogenase
MSDAKENTPNKSKAPEGQNKEGNARRRSRGGRNKNRNRGKKEGEAKDGAEAQSKPAKTSESGPKEEGNGGNRNNRGRNRNNRNKRREGKDVKATPVSEEIQTEYDLQNDLYNIDFSSSSTTAEYEETVLEKPVIGITCGDLNGIGMEVIITMLEDTRLTELCTPVVFASSKLASYHRNAINKRDFQFRLCDTIEDIKEGANNLVLSWDDNVEITLGLPTDVSGAYALKSIDAAIDAAKNGKIHALLTAPINKHNIAASVEGFSGHTDYLAKEFGNEVLMILASDKLKVATVTGHVPISKVAESINEASVNKAIVLLAQSLKRDFGIVKPRIAVLGLNPHAGEMGTIGREEKDSIRPAIENAQNKNTIVKGPFPADGFFGQGYESKFDAVLGMYHDQVLVPFKSLAMGSGTNFTAGLGIVRASPDHGTAMHLAGKGKADATSMRNALYTAIDVYHARTGYDEMTKDPLKKQKEKS